MSNGRALVADQFDNPEQERTAARLGMWVFLATEILFFGVLFAAYLITRLLHAPAFAEAGRHTDFWLGTLETGVLLSSSLTVALAARAAQLGQRQATTRLLALTALLGLTFLGVHAVEYYHEYHEHLIPGLNFAVAGPPARGVELFFFLYYVMTGFHGLHVLIGVGVLSVLAALSRQGRFDADYFTPVELAALYWHLVDIVWLFLYPLFYLVARA